MTPTNFLELSEPLTLGPLLSGAPTSALASGVLTLYYLVLGILAAYGVHRLWLVWDFLRPHRNGFEPAPQALTTELPTVTVQLPIFNELYVAERLIDAVAALDYPADRLEIQVLDDSTDETTSLVAARVASWQARGVDIVHIHRQERHGFKAGALAHGFGVARGSLIAVFDADFVPGPSFLKDTVTFFADPQVGMVQARWGHLNRDFSLLTRVQGLLLDGHFVVEHEGRHRAGCFFNFNGTAGIWRRRTIEDAGGWEHDTLTEDLDLSYRAQLKGWRFVYLPNVVVPAELPAEINAYKSQQNRWAMGSIQTCRKLLGKILRAPIGWRAKTEAFVHLTANGTYFLMLLLSLLIFPAMVLRRGDDPWPLLLVDLPLFGAATLAISAFFLVSQRGAGGSLGRCLVELPALMAVGIGLAVNNSRAVLRGLVENGGVFHRTPKLRLEGPANPSVGAERYRLKRNSTFYLELLLALYFATCFLTAMALGMWWSLPFLWLFLQGFGYMSWLGLRSLRPASAL